MIPARFLALMAQLISTSMIYFSKDGNIRASLDASYSNSDYDSKDGELSTGVTLLVVFLALQTLSIFQGYTLFLPTINASHIFFSCLGTILTCWFIIEAWTVSSYWYLFVFFGILPLLMESFFVIREMCCSIQW